MFKCDSCGEVDHLLIDGYEFGDRQLEGVQFEIRRNNGKLSLKVCDDDADYFSDFNTEKWLKTGEKFISNHDVATCPKCGDDVGIQE